MELSTPTPILYPADRGLVAVRVGDVCVCVCVCVVWCGVVSQPPSSRGRCRSGGEGVVKCGRVAAATVVCEGGGGGGGGEDEGVERRGGGVEGGGEEGNER